MAIHMVPVHEMRGLVVPVAILHHCEAVVEMARLISGEDHRCEVTR